MISEGYYGLERPSVQAIVPLTAKRILDIGCAEGKLGEALKHRQPAFVCGVEPVGEAAAIARDRLDHVINQSIEAALETLEDGSFDCVIMADVLEHLQDPWSVLRKVSRKLEVGGRLVASVPNAQNWAVIRDLIEGHWRYDSEGLLDQSHLRFFTRESVERLCWNAGLRIDSMTTTEHGSTAPRRLLAALDAGGLDSSTLRQHGTTWQHLVVAVRPAPRSTLPKISIIVLNWNGKADTLACLESLASVRYGNFETILVDNGSSDDSVREIRTAHPQLTVLETGANLGFAEGNNVGIRHALANGADHVLLLNNDTVVDPGMLDGFLDALHVCPGAGILGARIYYHSEPQKIWYAGGYWDHDQMCFQQVGDGLMDHAVYGEVSRTDFVVGCAMFIPRGILEKVGLLESSYFLNYEEIDFCTRVRNAGYDLIYAPEARLWHKIAASFGGDESPLKIYFTFRNRLLWARRNLPWRRRVAIHLSVYRWFRPRFLLGLEHLRDEAPLAARLKSVFWSLRSAADSPTNQAWLRGIMDFWLGRFGKCPDAIWKLNRRWAQTRKKS